MNKIAQRVYDLALPVAEKMGLDIWDVEYLKEAGDWYLRVYIDKLEGGIFISDCENFSREMDPILDEADPIEGSYVFEVSSAGASSSVLPTLSALWAAMLKLSSIRQLTDVKAIRALFPLMKTER